MWIAYALLSLCCIACANTIQEYIADNTDTSSTFVRQYILLLAIASIAVLIFDTFALGFDQPYQYILLFLVWWIGYVGIRSLIRWLQHYDVAPVFLIAYTYVILSYLLNIYLIWDDEVLSIEKLLWWCLFLVAIVTFLLTKKQDNHQISPYMYLIYPCITAFCRAIFFSGINWYIKSDLLSPLQSVFYTEWIIALIALSIYCISYHPKTLIATMTKKNLIASFGRSIFVFVGWIASYMAYSIISANTVNTIRLFGIIWTTLCAWFFLQEHISKSQLIPIILATITLIWFTLTP